jgi:biotin transport system substrate-specific component
MNSTRNIAFIALFTALLCVLAPISIPIQPVALTLGTLAIYIIGALLDYIRAPICVLLYLIIGFLGVPVFSNYNGGAAVLFGLTGGFLIGYIPGILVQSLLTTWKKDKIWMYPLAMVAGTFFIYAFGLIWFMIAYQNVKGTSISFSAALMSCVVPFLLWDAAKIVVATLVSVKLRKPLDKALRIPVRKNA